MTTSLLVIAALLIDRFIGEPPNALHPVVWIGNCTRWLAQNPRAHALGPRAQLVWGACVALLIPGVFAGATWLLLREIAPWPASSFVVSALLLKSALSLDGLRKAGERMIAALGRDLPAARDALRHLCSRDPSTLSSAQLVAGTVESLAENTSDSVIAPLFYFALFGVPGAVAYRAINTLDAMIGYHGRYEYLGKTAARIDDVLNLIPARLTACLLIVAGALLRRDAAAGWSVMRRDASSTESPNAGWPMAAMAGLLGVRLEKPDHYVLGDGQATLSAGTIQSTWSIVQLASWIGAAILVLVLGGPHVIR